METLTKLFYWPITWAAVIALFGFLGLGVWQIFRGVLVSRINRLIDKRWAAGLFALGRYKISLKDKLMDMPFLYRDMRLNAKDDYVEMTISTADAQVTPLGVPTVDYRTPLLRFRQSRRAVLFGDGGFGKTTLFRHVILRSLGSDRSATPFDRRSVPVFVALKAIKLSGEFPLLECIQNSSPVFSGPEGYSRLRNLARTRRLVIFLDGYDEMPYAGGVAHVVSEIETLFGKYEKSRPTFFEAKKDFYIFAQECRIYISSRREFFFQNKFNISSDVPRWLVRGLGDRRADLIERIFARYKEGNDFLSERLDQELFIQQMAESCDSHLVDLSYSPLFLTVMCYIYVDSIKDKSCDGQSVFNSGAHGLIGKCIDLLISDVDEYKARGLNEAQRSALIHRRASYPEEKMTFLKYFVGYLYEGSVGVFDRATMIDCAKELFKGKLGQASHILQGLDSEDPTINIVDQLIFSGLFVVVDFRKDIKVYDFPHRSFREALAVDFYSTQATFRILLDNFDDPSYTELALIYIEQSQFGETIFDRVLDKLKSGTYERRHGDFLIDALRRANSEVQERFVLNFMQILSTKPLCLSPLSLILYLPRHDIYREKALANLYSAVTGEDENAVGFWWTIIITLAFELIDGSLVKIINLMSIKSIRQCMYAPVTMTMSIRNSLVERLITLSTDRIALIHSFFDIYRCFFIGKKGNDRNLVRAIAIGESEALCHIFGCAKESLVESFDYIFGGIALPEGRKSSVFLTTTEVGLPPTQSQFYSR